MKQLKLIVALTAGLFAFSSANAGEFTVTGSMHATYQSEVDDVTGNPLGMNTDLSFNGSTEVLNGTTVTMSLNTDGTFLGDSGADHSLKFANDYGTFRVANNGDSANAVDDITPTAFEEANGSGSGTYTVDMGSGMDGSMSVGYNLADILGTGISVDYTYYPKLDGKTNNEKGSSADNSGGASSAESINIGIPLSGVPGVGSTPLGEAKITLGYEKSDSRVTDAQHKEGGTVAVVLPVGPLSVGYQKKGYQSAGTSGAEAQDGFFKDDIIGIAYAVNDELAVSYNLYQSDKHLHTSTNGEVEQETKAINVAYTVGGVTLAFQDAKTTNGGYAVGTDDDTRTFSLKTSF